MKNLDCNLSVVRTICARLPPSTLEMLTTSRPPPRRCSAACLPGSATRRLCIFASPTAGCPVTMLHVCALSRVRRPSRPCVFTPDAPSWQPATCAVLRQSSEPLLRNSQPLQSLLRSRSSQPQPPGSSQPLLRPPSSCRPLPRPFAQPFALLRHTPPRPRPAALGCTEEGVHQRQPC